MTRGIAAFVLLATVATAACVSGDVDEEKPTESVPAGITPEDATFRFISLPGDTGVALAIRLSTIALCKAEDVPDGQPFVELFVVPERGKDVEPGIYPLLQANETRIRLMRMTAPECESASSIAASTGQIQLDEISDAEVRGSFVGTNRDSKIELRGSFIATHCPGVTTCD